MGDDTNPSTEELLIVQRDRERDEMERADDADLPDEEHAANRRADRANYLIDKLKEQQAADEGR